MDLSEEIQNFIFSDEDLEIYSHRTTSAEVAQRIMDEGFRFSESFQKTTDEIINDLVYIRYWDSMRKHYGNIIVVLAFSKDLVKNVRQKLKTNYEVHQALSRFELEGQGELSGESNFILPTAYIKGYIHRETGEIHPNPNFDPSYIPPFLDKQIEYLNTHIE